MVKLWEKGYTLNQVVEKFMTGDDPELDRALLPYDCLGSVAHALMLEKIEVISDEEYSLIKEGLSEIYLLAKNGSFEIQLEDEDVHTAVENYITEKLGDTGKKIHTARSRNDQVLLDIRLYMRDQLLMIFQAILDLCRKIHAFADKHKHIPIPGRTHFQRAMPSSIGLWSGAFFESLLDDLQLIIGAYDLIDQCPLGSAASYGVSLPIDRQLVSDILGFRCVQNNVLYANNSRGKFEAIALQALTQVMSDLSKLSVDIIVFSAPEFGYLELPETLCPGSSLMPQKRNPCPLELIRAKASTVTGNLFQILEIIKGLPSGYNRDFQETKRPLMQSMETTLASVVVCGHVFAALKVDEEKCIKSFSPEVFATDQVLEQVSKGVPFRDAYRTVAAHHDKKTRVDPQENIASKKHQGATGNLGLDIGLKRIKEYQEWCEKKQNTIRDHFNRLINI